MKLRIFTLLVIFLSFHQSFTSRTTDFFASGVNGGTNCASKYCLYLWIRVVSPRKVSRFVPLNLYYIIIDEVFFDNFFIIIYLLVVCKKNNNSFILVYFNYLFICCIQKNNNSFILVYFCQRSQAKLFLQNFQKPHKNNKKVVFFLVPTQKCMKWLRCCTSGQITSFLMNCASNVKIVKI